MLTENQVVNAVIAHLRDEGWVIESFALATSIGDDIVASRDGHRLHVEAKGEGSSRPGSARFGRVFDGGQVLSHVSRATYRAMIAYGPDRGGAMAFPNTAPHRVRVAAVGPALLALGIVVFLVAADGSVTTMDLAAGGG